MSEKPLSVVIKDRNKIIYEGNAFSLSGVNETGPFSVLPQHANFITLIKGKLIIDKDTKDEKEFQIDRGVLHVSMNKAVGYIGI